MKEEEIGSDGEGKSGSREEKTGMLAKSEQTQSQAQ